MFCGFAGLFGFAVLVYFVILRLVDIVSPIRTVSSISAPELTSSPLLHAHLSTSFVFSFVFIYLNHYFVFLSYLPLTQNAWYFLENGPDRRTIKSRGFAEFNLYGV